MAEITGWAGKSLPDVIHDLRTTVALSGGAPLAQVKVADLKAMLLAYEALEQRAQEGTMTRWVGKGKNAVQVDVT